MLVDPNLLTLVHCEAARLSLDCWRRVHKKSRPNRNFPKPSGCLFPHDVCNSKVSNARKGIFEDATKVWLRS
jgi:hypothetical protein